VTALLLHETRNQQRLFWRSRESAFFTFLLPVAFLVLLGSVYGDRQIAGVKGASYLLAGMIGYGIVATAFAGLAINLVIRRESGVLKRVRGTPLPTAAYLAATMLSTLVVVGLMTVAQLLIGRYAIGATLPEAPGSFAVALLVGTTCFAALGLAVTGLVRSGEGSSAVITAIYLPMTFVSGSFFDVDTMPSFLRAIADVLPLTYLLRWVRDSLIEGRGIGSSWTPLGVLLGWGALGALVALRTFRWEPSQR
jgi:ABC-2 type transport system permease protein